MIKRKKNGRINDLDWNQYKTKDIAMKIGKQTGTAALKGAAIGVGMDMAQKVWNGEKIEASEEIEIALKTGADFGIKTALTGALKVAAEKGVAKGILRETAVGKVATVVHVGMEDAKIAIKVAKGEMTVKEGINECEMTTVSVAGGLAGLGKGAAIGGEIGAVLGPVGIAVGGFVGGTVGYMAGSKVGETVVKGKRKFVSFAKEKVKSCVGKVSSKIKDNAVTRKMVFWFS